MSDEKNDCSYMLYRGARKIIERGETCCKKDHSHEPLFQEYKELIRLFDRLGRGYAERYEKEKKMQELIKEIEDMCLLVDEFAKSDVTPGTPLYNFQQSMIANVKRYREKKNEC